MVEIDRLATSKVGSDGGGSHSSEISRSSSRKLSSLSSLIKTSNSEGPSGQQIWRPRRCLASAGYSGGSTAICAASPQTNAPSTTSAPNSRNRICSHRDNDEIFADLTYAPTTDATTTSSTSRKITFGQISSRSSTATPPTGSSSFDAAGGRMSSLLPAASVLMSDDPRPRTSSDTAQWMVIQQQQPLNPRLLPPSVALIAAARGASALTNRPRARSLTHQQLATQKPLSQPIGVKDLEAGAAGMVDFVSRSSSTTSSSRGIMKAIEQVLGRPRSIEGANNSTSGGGFVVLTTAAGEGGAVTASGIIHAAAGANSSPIHRHHQDESEIYAEMDFTRVVASATTSNPLRDSLLVTPSDSLSSNSSSSLVSYHGPPPPTINQTTTVPPRNKQQQQPVNNTTSRTMTANFNDHYTLVFSQGGTVGDPSTTTR